MAEPWPGAADDLPPFMKLKQRDPMTWRATYRWWAWPIAPFWIALCHLRLRREGRRLDRLDVRVIHDEPETAT